MKKVLAILIIVFQGVSGLSQGLNNEHPIDSTDIENTLDLLGMEIYKFPIYSKDSAYLNVVIEQYDNDTLTKSYNHIKNLEGIPKKYLNNVSMIATSDTTLFRVYFYRKNDATLIYRFNYGSISMDVATDDMKQMDDGTRAYDFKSIEENDGQVVLIWYGSEPSGEWRHCPGGIPLKQVVKQYDRVIAFKLQLQPID